MDELRTAALTLGLGLGLSLGLVLGSGGAARAPEAPPRLDPVAAERACADGAVESCARIGRAYRLGNDGVQQDLGRALTLLQRACTLSQHRSTACADYAELLKSGLAGKSDVLAALAVLDRACGASEPASCAYLGLIYTEGLGVPYTPPYWRVGVGFYRKACELGHPGGCWHLGLLLRAGMGVKKDETAARAFLSKACKAGEEVACADLNKPR